jgi:hypothetical protein
MKKNYHHFENEIYHGGPSVVNSDGLGYSRLDGKKVADLESIRLEL